MGASRAVSHISHRDVYNVLGQVLVGGGEAGPQVAQTGWRTATTAQGGSAAYNEDVEALRRQGLGTATAS